MGLVSFGGVSKSVVNGSKNMKVKKEGRGGGAGGGVCEAFSTVPCSKPIKHMEKDKT